MDIDIDWKGCLGIAAVILALTLGIGGCNYLCSLAKKTDAEIQQLEKK